MSEFSIDRDVKTREPSRAVDSSGETDADGGGGMNFVFHGGPGGRDEKKQEKPKPPQPIGPCVELSLSSLASVQTGGKPQPGDYGPVGGPVAPPLGIKRTLEKELQEAQELSPEEDPFKEPEQNAGPGSTLNIEA